MLSPIQKLKKIVLKSVSNNSENPFEECSIKFHLDPNLNNDKAGRKYSTFKDYDVLLDPYMNLDDRKYLWNMYQL